MIRGTYAFLVVGFFSSTDLYGSLAINSGMRLLVAGHARGVAASKKASYASLDNGRPLIVLPPHSEQYYVEIEDRRKADNVIFHLRDVIHRLDTVLKYGSIVTLRKAFLEQKGLDANTAYFPNSYVAAVQRGDYDTKLKHELTELRVIHQQVIFDCAEYGFQKAMEMCSCRVIAKFLTEMAALEESSRH